MRKEQRAVEEVAMNAEAIFTVLQRALKSRDFPEAFLTQCAESATKIGEATVVLYDVAKKMKEAMKQESKERRNKDSGEN